MPHMVVRTVADLLFHIVLVYTPLTIAFRQQSSPDASMSSLADLVHEATRLNISSGEEQEEAISLETHAMLQDFEGRMDAWFHGFVNQHIQSTGYEGPPINLLKGKKPLFDLIKDEILSDDSHEKSLRRLTASDNEETDPVSIEHNSSRTMLDAHDEASSNVHGFDRNASLLGLQPHGESIFVEKNHHQTNKTFTSSTTMDAAILKRDSSNELHMRNAFFENVALIDFNANAEPGQSMSPSWEIKGTGYPSGTTTGLACQDSESEDTENKHEEEQATEKRIVVDQAQMKADIQIGERHTECKIKTGGGPDSMLQFISRSHHHGYEITLQVGAGVECLKKAPASAGYKLFNAKVCEPRAVKKQGFCEDLPIPYIKMEDSQKEACKATLQIADSKKDPPDDFRFDCTVPFWMKPFKEAEAKKTWYRLASKSAHRIVGVYIFDQHPFDMIHVTDEHNLKDHVLQHMDIQTSSFDGVSSSVRVKKVVPTHFQTAMADFSVPSLRGYHIEFEQPLATNQIDIKPNFTFIAEKMKEHMRNTGMIPLFTRALQIQTKLYKDYSHHALQQLMLQVELTPKTSRMMDEVMKGRWTVRRVEDKATLNIAVI